MGRAKAENDQLRAECAQYALRAQQFSAASDAAKTMNSDLNSMAKQLEDKNLMLQASHEQHQLLTQQILNCKPPFKIISPEWQSWKAI